MSHSSKEKFITGEVVMVLWTVEREMEVVGGGGRRIGVLGQQVLARARGGGGVGCSHTRRGRARSDAGDADLTSVWLPVGIRA